MKKCFKCRRRKPIELFYKHSEMTDGHLGKCIACTKKDAQDRYNDPDARERIREYDKLRSQDPARKLKVKEYVKRRGNGKRRANRMVSNAIRDGRLIRQPCVICGDTKSQAHHDDYRKPLNVRWLCFKHHREAHGQKVKI